MVVTWIIVLCVQILLAFANTANPRVKVSIETNFGDTLKNAEDFSENANCGKTMDDSLPIGRFPWFAKIYVSKVSLLNSFLYEIVPKSMSYSSRA